MLRHRSSSISAFSSTYRNQSLNLPYIALLKICTRYCEYSAEFIFWDIVAWFWVGASYLMVPCQYSTLSSCFSRKLQNICPLFSCSTPSADEGCQRAHCLEFCLFFIRFIMTDGWKPLFTPMSIMYSFFYTLRTICGSLHGERPFYVGGGLCVCSLFV